MIWFIPVIAGALLTGGIEAFTWFSNSETQSSNEATQAALEAMTPSLTTAMDFLADSWWAFAILGVSCIMSYLLFRRQAQ